MSDNLAAVIEAGRRLGEPKHVEHDRSYAVIGKDEKVEDLEFLMPQPRRATASVKAHDVLTFNDYFLHYKSPISRIFADNERFQITAIFDYHGPDIPTGPGPQWCGHTLTYTAPRSPEWLTWTGRSGKGMTQPDFAQFIENNVKQIVADAPGDPSGADMLEVSRSLQAKKSVEFSSAIRLANGEQEFTFVETIQGTTGKGKLKVPERFVLALPVFFNDAPYRVEARLRYRLTEGKLTLWYDLFQARQVELDAFQAIVNSVAVATGVKVWMGAP